MKKPTKQVFLLADAMRELIKTLPVAPGEALGVNLGESLEDALKMAGYELQLHQHGIGGTSVMAIPLESVILDVPTV